MIDLFRFIEHNFVVPGAIDAIEVANGSDFQLSLAEVPASEGQRERIRSLSETYLEEQFPTSTADPAELSEQLLRFERELRALTPVNMAGLTRTVRDIFDKTPAQLTASAPFGADRQLLQNAVLAVKLLTGFDRVDARRLITQLRAGGILEAIADGSGDKPSRPWLDRMLSRPVRIPGTLLAAVRRPTSPREEPSREQSPEERRIRGHRQERDHLQAAYRALLTIQPRELELSEAPEEEGRREDPRRIPRGDDGLEFVSQEIGRPAPLLRLDSQARERVMRDHSEAFERVRIDLAHTSLETAVETVERRLTEVNEEVLPLEVATSANIFRLGGHLFAAGPPMVPLLAAQDLVDGPVAPTTMPDFSAAITRPVGIGNLQVVRQELVGYRPADISHIENVLEGELLRHDTERTEVSELILTEETLTSQSEERDHQSTDRNELSSETQKEASQQTTKSGESVTSTDYGRLVENNKSSFAKTVVERSVQSLTQHVRRQRVQRESKTFVERARHQFDNTTGTEKIRGIYQWVDKVYSLRVLNYGKRLLYDVVVPEPAAFLVSALKNAAQPETFELKKPIEPMVLPSQLNAGNYMWYAAQYGVTGSVSPPPQIYARTVAQVNAVRSGSEHAKLYGVDLDLPYHAAFKLTVPEGYRAVRGYLQHVNTNWLGESPGATIEALVGESDRLRTVSAENPYLSIDFQMRGETGEVPVTLRTFDRILSLCYSVALVCQRTDSALEQWQLKTHATIVSGYQRKLADYEDRLGRYVASVRAQMALSHNYSHNPSVTLEELKRAFIFLLLGEHPPTWLPTPPHAPVPPGVALADPVKVKKWGAVVAFFERAFEWENLMFTCYPYYWGGPKRWEEMLLTQDSDPHFEAFLKAGAARVVIPVRPGFEGALAHYQETGDVWMGEEMPDMFGENYVSIIEEIKAANFAPGDEVCVEQWEATLPTTLVLLKDDEALPSWTPTPCNPNA